MDRGTILAVALAVAVIAGLGSAGLAMAVTDGDNQTDVESPNETITVSDSAEVEAEPDEAVLTLLVEKTAKDPNTARTQLAENVSAVTDELEAMGFDEEAYRTTDYRIGEQDRPSPDGEDRERAYVARQTIEVTTDELDSVGSVIDGTVEAGATEVRNVQFTLSEETRDDLRTEALEAASDGAAAEAQTLAAASNLDLGSAQEITTESRNSPVVRYSSGMAEAAAEGTDIDAGPVTVTATVKITYSASPADAGSA